MDRFMALSYSMSYAIPWSCAIPPPHLASRQLGKRHLRDEFIRPVKKLTCAGINAEVLEWLRSKGGSHLTRINEILWERMMSERTS